jgi:hypothetical protein
MQAIKEMFKKEFQSTRFFTAKSKRRKNVDKSCQTCPAQPVMQCMLPYVMGIQMYIPQLGTNYFTLQFNA